MIVTGGETLPAAPSPELHIDTVNKLVTVIYDDSTQTDFQIADADWSESIVGQDTRYDFSYNQDGDTLSGHLLQGNNESKAEVEVQLGYASNASYTLPSQGNGLDNQIAYYHNDHLGTPQKLTDKDQTVVWEGYYSPFGEVNTTVATVENNLRFAGQYYDGESGLHYNYFRYYAPQLGRYITSDPIGLEGGLNTYGYAYQNPLYWIDPFGLISNWGGVDNKGDFKKRWNQDPDTKNWTNRETGECIDDDEYWHRKELEGLGDVCPSCWLGGGVGLGRGLLGGGKGLINSGPIARQRGAIGDLRKKPGSLGKSKGTDALRRENKIARDAANKAGLDKDQKKILHDEISGQDLKYKDILDIANDIKNGIF
ncbi:MAG: RHS domain-containing protein [Gammaproteobacteria bacterium]|nr:RHS domain-containing protein [Gammaproteobacteria bacterium]